MLALALPSRGAERWDKTAVHETNSQATGHAAGGSDRLRHGDGEGQQRDWSVRRKVSVIGSGGVTATVVVTVCRDKVLLSIQPPFTWDAIMEPGKVDEVIRTLTQAAREARIIGGRQ